MQVQALSISTAETTKSPSAELGREEPIFMEHDYLKSDAVVVPKLTPGANWKLANDLYASEEVTETCPQLEPLSIGKVEAGENFELPQASKVTITLPPKKQAGKFHYLESLADVVASAETMPVAGGLNEEARVFTETSIQNVSVETSTLLDILRTVRSNKVSQSSAGVGGIRIVSPTTDEVVASGSADVHERAEAQRRSENRCYGAAVDPNESIINCTLEETFSEITVKNTKEVLRDTVYNDKEMASMFSASDRKSVSEDEGDRAPSVDLSKVDDFTLDVTYRENITNISFHDDIQVVNAVEIQGNLVNYKVPQIDSHPVGDLHINKAWFGETAATDALVRVKSCQTFANVKFQNAATVDKISTDGTAIPSVAQTKQFLESTKNILVGKAKVTSSIYLGVHPNIGIRKRCKQKLQKNLKSMYIALLKDSVENSRRDLASQANDRDQERDIVPADSYHQMPNQPKKPLKSNIPSESNMDDSHLSKKQPHLNYETPVDTPLPTPNPSSPPKMSKPQTLSHPPHLEHIAEILSDELSGVRRSQRLKLAAKAVRPPVGRGLVRVKTRLKDGIILKSPVYSLHDQLTALAEVDAKNTKFFNDMGKNQPKFSMIKENDYKCERLICLEYRDPCNCILTFEEEERGELGCGETCLNRQLSLECGPDCHVKERCTNKRFQNYLYSQCRVFRTEKKGLGIMADIEILPGEFIMEYVGEVIDGEEYDIRRNLYWLDKNHHFYFMELRSDAYIDSTMKGNISRFINHSCDPNAETQKWDVNGELRIGFFSRKLIKPGEEITCDYQFERYGHEAQRCFCESSNCRGWIGGKLNADMGEQMYDEEDDEVGLSDSYEIQKVTEGIGIATSLGLAGTVDDYMHVSDDDDESVADVQDGDSDPENSNSRFKKLSNNHIICDLEKQKLKWSPDSTAPVKVRYSEHPNFDNALYFLINNGLVTTVDTKLLLNLMAVANDPETRLTLLAVLCTGELFCRRRFLYYHGLRVLHGWMRESGDDVHIRLSLLQTLECLPIANKTVLTDSKVYESIRNWCGATPLPAAGSFTTSPIDESSKESGESSAAPRPALNDEAKDAATVNLQNLALKLAKACNSLPEIFRLLKCERIEQIKDHGSEADLHYAVASRINVDGEEVAPHEADKRIQRKQYDLKCRFFGLDPKKTQPQDIPFCVDPATGQWYSAAHHPIPTPPKYAQLPIPVTLLDSVVKLPLEWELETNLQSKLYYYHRQHRLPQWEAPTEDQIKNTEVVIQASESDSESELEYEDSSDADEDEKECEKGEESEKDAVIDIEQENKEATNDKNVKDAELAVMHEVAATIKEICNNIPLLGQIVQNDNIVGTIDALKTGRALRRPLLSHRDIEQDPFDCIGSSKATIDSVVANVATSNKRRRLENKENL